VRSLVVVSAAAGVGLVASAGSDTAFYAVFAVFVAAFVVLAVVTLRWAVRRDRAGRAEWVRRRSGRDGAGAHPEPRGAHPEPRAAHPAPPAAPPAAQSGPRAARGDGRPARPGRGS